MNYIYEIHAKDASLSTFAIFIFITQVFRGGKLNELAN